MINKIVSFVLTLFLSVTILPAYSQEVYTYIPTNKICKKNNINKINNKNLICLKNNKTYKWHKITVSNNFIKKSNIDLIYDKINNGINSYKGQKININKIYSPNVNKLLSNKLINEYELSLQNYSNKIKNKITIITFTELEYDWWKNKVFELENDNSPSWWQSNHCPIDPTRMCGYGKYNDKNKILFYHLIGSKATWNNLHHAVIDHEVAHMYQIENWKYFSNNICWVAEGYANTIGFAQTSKKINVTELRQQQIDRLKYVFPNYLKLNEIELEKQILHYIDVSNNCYEHSEYSMGMLITEYLFKNYEFDIVEQFFIDLNKNNLEYSLNKHFNESKLNFVFKLSKYFIDTFTEIK